MRNTTKLTQTEIKAFQNSVTWGTFWKIELTVLFVSIVAGVVLIILGEEFGMESFGGTIIAWGLVFAVLYPIILLVLTNVSQKQLNPLVSDDTCNNYEFTDECMIETTTNAGEIVSVTKIKYSQIIKCVDYKEYLFLYISKVQAYIVDKGGMTSGTLDDLVCFLQGKDIKFEKSK